MPARSEKARKREEFWQNHYEKIAAFSDSDANPLCRGCPKRVTCAAACCDPDASMNYPLEDGEKAMTKAESGAKAASLAVERFGGPNPLCAGCPYASSCLYPCAADAAKNRGAQSARSIAELEKKRDACRKRG